MKKLTAIIVAALCAGFAVSCTTKAARASVEVDDLSARTPDAPARGRKPPIRTVTSPDVTAERRPEPPPPSLQVEVFEEQLAFARPEGVAFETIPREDVIVPPPEEWFVDTAAVVIDTVFRPTPGGMARVYLQREFMDEALSDMVRVNPFGDDGTERRIFRVTDSTHRRLELTLTGEIRRANGRRATALDFVELWSRFMKARPAQGLALFRNVQGAEGFVNGTNPLVNGFNAADENVIRIRFAKPDPLAFQRLNSPKLIGGPFMLGSYYTSSAENAEHKLLPNVNSLSPDAAFLQECVVVTGGDPDPLGSFAKGQYAAVTLYAARDLRAARAGIDGAAASLHKLPSDRYFISCKSEDENVRRFVRRSVNGRDLLVNVVGAEGAEIGSVVARAAPVNSPRGQAAVPQPAKPFRLIYRSDDPISRTIGERIAADLNAAGMRTDALPHAADKYEAALVRGQYDAAVGWAPETVVENETEQLHLASMWFADETDHEARVREFKEIPLFSVDNYLLLKEDMRLYGDRVSGLWKDTSGEDFDVD